MERPTWQGTEVLSPTACKELNSANNYVSLEADPFLLELEMRLQHGPIP